MKLLKGKVIADKILRDIKDKIKKSRKKPALTVILVGRDPASELYVKLKRKAAKKIGIGFNLFKFSGKKKESAIIGKIEELNKDENINGIIVQLPLPKKYHTQKIINSINPRKDVDGFTARDRHLKPVFPTAITELIMASKIKLKGKKAVILTNSGKFGEVMNKILERERIKARYVLSKNLEKYLSEIKKADIIISAVGKPNLIKGNMVKKGTIVIDGGITKRGKKVLGDVDFGSVKNTASYVSPVPGGVGPVTVACLLKNVWLASKK